MRSGLDSNNKRQGSVASCYDLGNETSISMKGGEFLDNLNGYLHPKKDFVPYVLFMDIILNSVVICSLSFYSGALNCSVFVYSNGFQ